jgi:tRNA 2-selenouridine synthase
MSSDARTQFVSRWAALPLVSVRDALAAPGATLIDLRTPAEFREDHLPGAHNVPLLDDLDRVVIGTLYTQRSPQAAFDEGKKRVRARIELLVYEIADLAGWAPGELDLCERLDAMTSGGLAALEAQLETAPCDGLPEAPVIFSCWRGGLRSRCVTSFVRALGLTRAVVLSDGYKGYRAEVRERLAAWRAPTTFVLRGCTGVGKTLVLRELERLRPGWTLDLEALAGHRSSILGMVGLQPCSQKEFESRLIARMGELGPGPLVIEGESRKIGDTILPLSVWEALANGVHLELVAPLERRIDVLLADYLSAPEGRTHAEVRSQLRAQLPFIERRLGPVQYAGALTGLFDSGRERQLVELLLERYYDPLYAHSERGRRPAASFESSDPRRAAIEIATWVEARLAQP